MKNILVIGATGQIGSELTMKLRSIYGNDQKVAPPKFATLRMVKPLSAS